MKKEEGVQIVIVGIVGLVAIIILISNFILEPLVLDENVAGEAIKIRKGNKLLWERSSIKDVKGGASEVKYHYTDGSFCKPSDTPYRSSCPNNQPCIQDPQRQNSYNCGFTNIVQGKPCRVSAQCAQGLSCVSPNPRDDPALVTNLLFTGRCQPILQAGAVCARWDQCSSGRCSSQGVCATPLAANAACNPSDDSTNCAPPLRCRYETYTGFGGHTGTLACRDPLPEDALCNDGPECLYGRCVDPTASVGGNSQPGAMICSISAGY